jgi:hypothetical protein
MSPQADLRDVHMNAAGLYREEVFTDRRIGTIRRLLPVTAEGSVDPARPPVFEGQMTLLTPAGSLPLSFDIEAQTLADAVEKFAAAAQGAVEQTLRELDAIRREAASSIVLPGQGGAPGLGDLGALKGMPPGGKLRRP